MKDLQDVVFELKGRGIGLRATEQPIDTMTAAGKAFLDMLGVFAEFETNLRRERQAEGIAVAKARGVYTGRKARIDPEAVRRLIAEAVKPAHVARELKISRVEYIAIYKAKQANDGNCLRSEVCGIELRGGGRTI